MILMLFIVCSLYLHVCMHDMFRPCSDYVAMLKRNIF